MAATKVTVLILLGLMTQLALVLAQNTTGDVSITCPGNLACVKSTGPAIPPFSVQLPSIPLPDGSNLLGTLDTSTLINFLKGKVPTYAADFLTQVQCGQSIIPAFTTETITKKGFLGTLSDGSCENVNSQKGQLYLVGAMSTKAVAFVSNLTSSAQSKVQAAKKAGNDYAMCLALDPCNGNYYLGMSGLSKNWIVTLGALPPANLTADFQSISYSVNGDGAGIDNTTVGLWYFNNATSYIPKPVSISGNLDAKVAANLTWGFAANGVRIGTITMVGQIELVVKWSNPTRFALQTTSTPVIDLFPGNNLKIDVSKLSGSVTFNTLFYVEHFDPNNYNVWAGLNVATNLGAVLSSMPGPIGDLLNAMIKPSSQLQTNLNIHLNQDGGGIRFYFSGALSLSDSFANIIKTFGGSNLQTSWDFGIGIKLMIVRVNGKPKVYGFVNIGGVDWSYGFCSANSDCLPGQYCYLGVCATAVGCLASQGRDYVGDVSFVGVCPLPGNKQW